MWLLFFLGTGLFVFGLLWLTGGLLGGGFEPILNVGSIATVIGFSLILIALYFLKLEKRRLSSEVRAFTNNRDSVTVGILVTAVFIAGILLYVYPGYGWRLGTQALSEAPPKVSFEGLKDTYKVGEELDFTVKLEGYWNDCGVFPQTEIVRLRDETSPNDVMLWVDRGAINDYSNPSCDHNPDMISKMRHIQGNPFKPLRLLEEGTYEVRSGGDDTQGASHKFIATN